jgi:hypothetical protein
MSYAIAIKALSSFLSAGASFHAAFAAHTNKAGHVPAQLINEAARTVAKRYGCHAELRETGWKFLVSEDDKTRHGTAQQFWEREIRPYDATPKSARGGSRTAASVDPVAKEAEKIKASMTPAQIKRLIAALQAA